MQRQIPYGIANYAEMVREKAYFVDKTPYIAQLEGVKNPVFLRPRRFGKTMFCSMLRHYYDLNLAARFDELFAHTWIGQHPTATHNQYMVLSLNFSDLTTGPTIQDIEHSFKRHCNSALKLLYTSYAPLRKQMPKIMMQENVADNLAELLYQWRAYPLPPLYVIIDEYDNFANQLILNNKDQLYRELTAEGSFFKTFFKTLKKGREEGAIANIFITGILPMMIDDLASAYNIATFLSLDPHFEAMLGFTQAEVTILLDQIYSDYAFDPVSRPAVETVIKNHYNGYHFVDPQGEALYNSTILMYFLRQFCQDKVIPKRLTDMNLKTDLGWVRKLTGSNPALTEAFVDQLMLHNRIAYDDTALLERFSSHRFFEPSFFPISFYYLGLLTVLDTFYLKLPNLNLRQIFVEYFNELHQIDVSTRYAEMMQGFINRPDLEQLFAGYWTHYVSQLPEAIFTQVNENFYRTTFFELCSRYLSTWFTWNVERSYPQGKSDLEFVGKYHEAFADLRWVIEFKYYSNAEFKKRKTSIEKFTLQADDTTQIKGYAQGLRQEYPNANISLFVIYCVGNQGFRVFTVEP